MKDVRSDVDDRAGFRLRPDRIHGPSYTGVILWVGRRKFGWVSLVASEVRLSTLPVPIEADERMIIALT